MAPFPSPTSRWHDNTYESINPRRVELSAKGKTVLITGAGTGIGAETARSFAEAGASRIALLGRREQPLFDTKASIGSKYPDVDIYAVSVDVTDKSEVDAAFKNFVGDGRIDVVVSNAAVVGPQDSVKDVDNDKFLKAVNTNLGGAINIAQAFLRHASKDAVAIEINSSAAHVNFGPGFASYSVAKLAVYRLWDSLAFANPGLKVYHVQPGIVNTDMNKEAGGVEAAGFEDHVSLPANFCVYLASNKAKYLRGKYLWSNWDVDELEARAKEIESSTFLNINIVGWPFESDDWKFEATGGSSEAWSSG